MKVIYIIRVELRTQLNKIQQMVRNIIRVELRTQLNKIQQMVRTYYYVIMLFVTPQKIFLLLIYPFDLKCNPESVYISKLTSTLAWYTLYSFQFSLTFFNVLLNLDTLDTAFHTGFTCVPMYSVAAKYVCNFPLP